MAHNVERPIFPTTAKNKNYSVFIDILDCFVQCHKVNICLTSNLQF